MRIITAREQVEMLSPWRIAMEIPDPESVPPEGEETLTRLQNEFDDWWEQYPYKGDPFASKTQWAHYPDKPVTHWPNVERFLRERYPDSAMNVDRGIELASPLLNRFFVDPDPPGSRGNEWLRTHYGPPPKDPATAAAMLELHNRAQGRPDWVMSDPVRRMIWERKTEKLRNQVYDEERAAARMVGVG